MPRILEKDADLAFTHVPGPRQRFGAVVIRGQSGMMADVVQALCLKTKIPVWES